MNEKQKQALIAIAQSLADIRRDVIAQADVPVVEPVVDLTEFTNAVDNALAQLSVATNVLRQLATALANKGDNYPLSFTVIEGSRKDFPNNLKEITLESNDIPADTFKNCKSLEKVNIGDNISTLTIGKSAFENSSVSVFDTSKVIKFGDACFNGSKITRFVVGKNVTELPSCINGTPVSEVVFEERNGAPLKMASGFIINMSKITRYELPEGAYPMFANAYVVMNSNNLKTLILPSTWDVKPEQFYGGAQIEKIVLKSRTVSNISKQLPAVNAKIYVPDDMVSAYKEHAIWSKHTILPISEFTE